MTSLLEERVEVRPITPYRLPRAGADGLMRLQGGVLHRLLHHDGHPVLVRAAQTAPDCVLIGARATSKEGARHGIERMRFALGVDLDVRAFHSLFRDDPVIGPSLRRRPWHRPLRRPEPFEALAWAICEQLIEYERAVAIERRLISCLGRAMSDGPARSSGIRAGSSGRVAGSSGIRAGSSYEPAGALRDAPSSERIAGVAPALLQSFDLAGSRAIALVRAAREIVRGRIDLHDEDHERSWRLLKAIPGVGPWTVEMLALHGQGREDQVPAGDLGLLKRVGRLLSEGDPNAFADEGQVRAFFARYEPWSGLAAMHLLMP